MMAGAARPHKTRMARTAHERRRAMDHPMGYSTRIHPAARIRQDRQSRAEAYARANQQAAAIILRETSPYGAHDSLMVRWARVVLNGERDVERAQWRLAA
jgi:hypothetical protein